MNSEADSSQSDSEPEKSSGENSPGVTGGKDSAPEKESEAPSTADSDSDDSSNPLDPSKEPALCAEQPQTEDSVPPGAESPELTDPPVPAAPEEALAEQGSKVSLTETELSPKVKLPESPADLTESQRDHPEDVLDTKSLADLHKEKGFEQDLLETKSLNQIRSTRGGTKAGSERIQKAYGLVNNLLRDRLETEDDENLELLDGLKASDVLVVNGSYDHIHLVLENLNIPFLTTFPNALPVQELRPDQTVFVNCGRDFPVESAFVLEQFVRNGGQMISTDWALKTVLQVAFPRYVQYNRRPTKDEVVGIEVMDKDDPVLTGFIDEEENPVWWLEDASYPIRILDKETVEVLIRSEELGKRYGEDAVLVKFHHGEGVVYHMISHFYLQRAETRSAKQKSKASSYAKSKGASPATLAQFKLVEEASADMDYGLTQTAMTSAEFVSRSILSQRKRFINKSKKTPKKPDNGD